MSGTPYTPEDLAYIQGMSVCNAGMDKIHVEMRELTLPAPHGGGRPQPGPPMGVAVVPGGAARLDGGGNWLGGILGGDGDFMRRGVARLGEARHGSDWPGWAGRGKTR